MRIREGLFAFVAAVAIVAVLVPAALAQQAPPGSPDPPPQPRGPTLALKLGGKDAKIRVGKHAKLFGTLRPWRPGQQVAVTLVRGDRTVKREVVPVSRGEGDAGHFGFRTPVLVRPGRYQATAQLAGGAATARSPKFKIKYPSLHRGSKGKDVKLFNRLLDRQGYVPSNGRRFTGRTARAVLAYRKVHGMAKTTRPSAKANWAPLGCLA